MFGTDIGPLMSQIKIMEKVKIIKNRKYLQYEPFAFAT